MTFEPIFISIMIHDRFEFVQHFHNFFSPEAKSLLNELQIDTSAPPYQMTN